MTHMPVGIIVDGATGRMGYRRHLVRSLLAIRHEGGVPLSDGRRQQIAVMLVGRSEPALREIAERHDIETRTTDLDLALADDRLSIYFDALTTPARGVAIEKAIEAGKHIYSEKPLAGSRAAAARLVHAAHAARAKTGVVHDKLYLSRIPKLERLLQSGFFGDVLSVRCEFGYWVFEGDLQPALRPSWNYQAARGGGITLDVFPHWSYLIENLFGSVLSVYAHRAKHTAERVDEAGSTYAATADDASYALLELERGVIAQINSSWDVRVNRRELIELQVDGTHGSAVAGLFHTSVQPREVTPRPAWNPDLRDPHTYASDWIDVPDNEAFENGFRLQWEEFLQDVAEDAPYRHDFASGLRAVELAEAAVDSCVTGQKVEITQTMESHP